ncbi:SCO family protein [Shewanella psychrotolerans]|uniref:SCO family protein n=1 Tax=Shewanella psychrotolerans TaxID=2864206 RepID=UPI001C65EF46|nr:SCO family protein [Shewanella psychrotolerans]QYK01521.1 SCO family protein [Shewanella psychrotolerans]
MRITLLILGMLLFAGLGSFAAISYHSSEPELTTSYLYPEQRKLSPFQLTDQHGEVFNNDRLKGKWSLIFIGYTSCPDVCPTTMAKLAAAYQKLASTMDIQVVFVSVDPARDTQAKLLDYINFFNSDFVAVTASHASLLPLTRQLGFVYAMVGDGQNYQVDHSASMVLISPEGRRYATIKPKARELGQLPQITTTNLIADITELNQHYQR